MFLIEFDNLRVHKEILALWHDKIIERIIRERLTPVVSIEHNKIHDIKFVNYHAFMFLL